MRSKRRRVELVHESFLKQWPRLVRWRAEEIGGAQLRDELRQAAQMWDQHERSADYLWSGVAFREYELWRERYAGGLTNLENDFVDAMTAYARRRKRRVTFLVAAVVTVLVAGLTLFVSLWQRSEAMRATAEAETRRAVSSKLLALGHEVLKEDHTAALAYAIESLRLADTPEGRRFAIEALWSGPPVLVTPPQPARPWHLDFSPDGTWLGVSHEFSGEIIVLPQGGGAPILLDENSLYGELKFSLDSSTALSLTPFGDAPKLKVWSVPDWTLRRTERVVLEWQEPMIWADFGRSRDELIVMEMDAKNLRDKSDTVVIQRRSSGAKPVQLGTIHATTLPRIDPAGERIAFGYGNQLRLAELEALDHSIVVGSTGDKRFRSNGSPAFDPKGRFVASCADDGDCALWSIRPSGGEPLRRLGGPRGAVLSTVVSADGTRLCVANGGEALIWDLEGVTGAEPLSLSSIGSWQISSCGLHPSGTWATTAWQDRVAFWNFAAPRRTILQGHEGGVSGVVFSSDSRYLYSLGATDGRVVRWPLHGSFEEREVEIFQIPQTWGMDLAIDPADRFLVVTVIGGVWRVPLSGAPATLLWNDPSIPGPALDRSGRRLALAPHSVQAGWKVDELVVKDLETGDLRTVPLPVDADVTSWDFDRAGRLVLVNGGALQVWDPSTDQLTTLVSAGASGIALAPDGRTVVTSIDGNVTIIDLETGEKTANRWNIKDAQLWDPRSWRRLVGPAGSWVAEIEDGTIRVGRFDRGDPHLLSSGIEGREYVALISPDGEWVADAGPDGIHLWPMPDLDATPLHTLPHEELMEKLEALTNVRAVEDKTAPNGYRIEIDESIYRGWAVVPDW